MRDHSPDAPGATSVRQDQPGGEPEDSITETPVGSRSGPTSDLIAGVLLIALAFFVTCESLRMPLRGPLGFFTGPGFVPATLGAALAVLGAILVAQSIRLGGAKDVRARLSDWQSPESTRLAIVMALMALLAFITGRIPYWAANLVYFILIFAFLRVGGRRVWMGLLLAVVLALFVGVLLPWAFELKLP